jgi:hypothetical protein
MFEILKSWNDGRTEIENKALSCAKKRKVVNAQNRIIQSKHVKCACRLICAKV